MEIFDKRFEKPLTLRSHEVRAILEGHKTQSRKVINPNSPAKTCPFGKAGYKLWVKERWAANVYRGAVRPAESCLYAYMADFIGTGANAYKWQTASMMPRQVSRLTLEITQVRVEYIQNISDVDCLAEGVIDDGSGDIRGQFEVEWSATNFSTGYVWRENLPVWVLEYQIYEVEPSAVMGYDRVINFIKAKAA